MTWFGLSFHVAYPMVCFCDIPLSRINEHTTFYGSYGIGLSKEWGLKNNLSPVSYCNGGNFLADVSDYLVHEIVKKETAKQKKKREIAFWKLVKNVKQLKGNMVVSGSMVAKDFYQESEWRYTPSEDIDVTVLFQDAFDKEKDAKNREIEKHKLQFSPTDIKYIFVQSDSDIPQIVDFINHSLGAFPHNDLKVLNSRIISLSTIETDW